MLLSSFAWAAWHVFALSRCGAQPMNAESAAEGETTPAASVAEPSGTSLDGGEHAAPESKSGGSDQSQQSRITLLGLDDDSNDNGQEEGAPPPRLDYDRLHANDMTENSVYDPFEPDPSCAEDDTDEHCWHPPASTVDEGTVTAGGGDCDDGQGPPRSPGLETLAWGYGGLDPDDALEEEGPARGPAPENGAEDAEGGKESAEADGPAPAETCPVTEKFVDKHWGSDLDILQMRDRLRGQRGKYWDLIEQDTDGNATHTGNETASPDKGKQRQEKEASRDERPPPRDRAPRPPVFLLPGLASTRLVAWKHKACPQSSLLSDIKMLEPFWLNMNLLIQMATIDARCWSECMTLGKYQADYDGDDDTVGCKLRPEEGLDSISSLARGSVSSNLFVGGTNTVYAWLIQWLADNLGYDVTCLVPLPYDWRLSPDKMEERDGFLTLTRKKIEASVLSNGRPGIMVAHSMGNSVFRYFLEWLKVQMREEAYQRLVQKAKHAAATRSQSNTQATSAEQGPFRRGRALYHGLLHPGEAAGSAGDAAKSNSAEDTVSEQKQEESEKSQHDGNKRRSREYPALYDLAKVEGDTEWIDWLGKHIWTYVGLSAPLLGAHGPLRSVLSGENMGLPFTDEEARGLELSFGSTSTGNTISTKMGFCDGDDVENGINGKRNLACLEELVSGIESSSEGKPRQTNPWQDFPALRLLLKDRVDFDSSFSMVRAEREFCEADESSPCKNQTKEDFGPKDVMNGHIFRQFSQIWKEKEDPLGVKFDQLRQSWWQGNIPNTVPNMLEITPDRPHIKHVILAYGTDIPTEVGYHYRKTDVADNSTATNTTESEVYDGVPPLVEVIWEEPQGRLASESKVVEPASFKDKLLRKKKEKRRPLKGKDGEAKTWLHHSGDGTIPYISLMWAHTWLLHATRAMRITATTPMLEGERISNPDNALDAIKVTHRPEGGSEWVEGYGDKPQNEENVEFESRSNIGDTGTSHPHGTKYKPKMVRFQSSGKSRSTGMEYTTTVIEAIGVEHKETTRNYDILAAVFTDILKNLHTELQ